MKIKLSHVLLAASCMAPASAALAGSLLLDGDFNNNAAWNKSTDGAGWANWENKASVSLDGSQYLVVGSAGQGGGRFGQTVAADAGASYTLEVFSGADAWWLPTGTMSLYFLGANASLLGSASRNTVDPAVYGVRYDIPHPWEAYSLSAVAPAGTQAIKVEFAANNATGSIWFENASLSVSAVPEPSAWLLMAMGLIALPSLRRHQNRRA